MVRLIAERLTPLEAQRLVGFIVLWSHAAQTTEGWRDMQLSDQVRVYAEQWRSHERTVWRSLALVRRTLPELGPDSTPEQAAEHFLAAA